MAQAHDRAEWRVKPWAGTIQQLRRAAERCREKVASAVPYPVDYEPGNPDQGYDGAKHEQWHAADSARKVSVSVIEHGGFSQQLTDISDLQELEASDQLDRIEGIEIDVGGIQPSAKISASDWRGLDVKLTGPNRSWTAGLRHELEDDLKPPGRLRLLPVDSEVFAMAGAVLALLLFIGLNELFYVTTDWVRGARVGAALGLAALMGGAIISMGAGMPSLELLTPGKTPAFQRRRGRLVGAIGVIGLGIVASLLAAAVNH
jgi:hypothetical protein